MNALERYSPLLFLLMWSSGAIFVKLGLEDASVSVFLTVRAIGATAALFMVFLFIARGAGAKSLLLPKPLMIRAILIGILLQVGYQSAYFLALNYKITPGVLAIILGLQPIITPMFANEKIGRLGYFYLSLGLVGLITAIVGAREIGAVTGLGLLFGLISVVAISIGSVMQKRSVINPIASAFYQALTASFVFLAVLPFTTLRLNLTPEFILSASWMIVVVSTLAVLLLFRMLVKDSASKVGVLFYMVPVVTIFLDYLTFGNTVSWITVAGALLIIMAVKGFGKVHFTKAPAPPVHTKKTYD